MVFSSSCDIEMLDSVTSRQSEDLYWLALTYKYTPVNLAPVLKLYERLGSIKHLWDPSVDLGRYGFNHQSAAEIARRTKESRPEDRELMKKHLDERGIKLIRYYDPEYPPQLRTLVSQPEGAPIVLYRQGTLKTLDRCVSVVGTRVLSQYGHSMARHLAKSLASRGYTVASGLARGTDTEAHCGALEAPRGHTVAVAPWMEPLYPSENVELASDIMKRGCVVSEFLQDYAFGRIAKSAFIRRNRITSGLSLCVIAIESDVEGGTAHQVKIAIAQGRQVFALEPRSDNQRARRGYDLFLRLGATPFKSPSTVFRFLERHEVARGMDRFIRAQQKLQVDLR